MRKYIVLIVATVFLYACGYHEGIMQKAEISFIKFSGNVENVSVQIDDMSPFNLKSIISEEKVKTVDKTLYQISPGKHSVKIYRDGILIVNRILLLETQATIEVMIP